MAVSIVNLFQVWGRNKSIDKVLRATEDLRKYVTVEEKVKLSPEAQEIKEICISYGQTGVKLARLFSIVMKENITLGVTDKIFPFIQFSCLCPKNGSVAGHEEGELMFALIPDREKEQYPNTIKALRINGTLGTDTPLFEKNFAIPSNDRIIVEMDEMFDGLVEKGIDDGGM